MFKRLAVMVIFLIISLCEGTAVYLSVLENQTGSVDNQLGVMYKVFFPTESADLLLPPGTKKMLRGWINLPKQSQVIIAPLKGDGDPIFLEWGPESSGQCTNNQSMVQSIIYWIGAQNTLSAAKTYQSYCLNDEEVELGLRIKFNGEPEIYAIKGAYKTNEF